MLDFVEFINDNWEAASGKKLALLNSFVAQYGYEEMIFDGGIPVPNPVSKKEFTNMRITGFIRDSVNAFRRREAEAMVEFEELILE